MWAKSVNRYEKEWKIYKQCPYCLEYIEATKEHFSWKKAWFMWLRSMCKNCEHKKYIMNKNYILKKSKERYLKNRDKCLSQVKNNYFNNREKKLEYASNYRKLNNESIKIKDKKRYRNKRYWLSTKEEIDNFKLDRFKKQNKNWNTFHWRTYDFLKNNWLYPNRCSICLKENVRIDAHHPDYSKRNEVVLCCKSCHRKIHTLKIQCPQPINILELIWRRK